MQQWKAIRECGAYTELKQCLEKLPDLTDEAVLTPERISRYVCTGPSFRLLYGCQHVSDEILDCFQKVADEARLVEQFRKMRRGVVLNKIEGYPSEERQVLHTSCRDIFSSNPASPIQTGQGKAELKKLKQFLHEVENGEVRGSSGKTFTTLVHVGIGGSDLGPRSIYEALRAYNIDGRNVHFIANVDPDDAADVLQELDLSRTLVAVVSKSGTTLETLSNETLVREALRDAGLDPAKHCLAVTGESSPMDNPDRYLRSFYMYDYIGGRFSSTSVVGVVMLSFALGYTKVEEFLKGAVQMDEAAEENNVRKNLPLLLALLGVWNHTLLQKPTVAVLPYSQALHRFAAHLQQCDMESNGKSVQRNGELLQGKSGPVVWGEPGTNGQHAFYQLLHQGTEDVAIEFIGFRKSQRGRDMVIRDTTSQQKLVANLLAQSLALAVGKDDENPNKVFSGNRANSVLMGERLTPESMGALLALYEAKIVFQGFCWNVNSFDQEGVQLGKVLAGEFLSAMVEKKVENSVTAAFLQSVGIR